MDCFPWSHNDMIGIDPSVITHKLSYDPSYKPVQQKKRKFVSERNHVINQKVDNLLAAGKIREVKYPEWLSNVVVVPKKNGKWRVCVDFIDLNKSCPKDPFPLPHIYAMVDATAGHEMLTFLEAWSGYNQIKMHPGDQEKTTFRSERGIYCYNAMPFGLKNAGSTYQRLVNMMFNEKISQTMEHLKKIPDEAESDKVYLRGLQWKISGIHGDPEGDRGQHRTNQSNSAAGVTLETKRRPASDWNSGSRKQVHIQILRQMQRPALQTLEEQDILNLDEDKGEQVWELNVDGASNARGAEVGLVLKSPQGNLIVQAVRSRDSRMMAYLDVPKELTLRFATFNIKKQKCSAALAVRKKLQIGGNCIRTGCRMISYQQIKRRFDIPSEIICDNVSQFIGNKTEAFCARWNILLQKSTPRNPQSNEQAESSNKIIVENLKKKLEERGGKWAEELPLVLWADRTTPKVATGQTPFSLVFGAESVIPSEVRVPTHRYGCIIEDRNQVEMASNLDTIDELRTSAQIRMASYRQTVARSYNKNVKVRTLQVGDLVMRKVLQNTKNREAGKFAYNLEGPYQVESIVGNGAYRLMTMEGQMVPRSWNIIHLKKSAPPFGYVSASENASVSGYTPASRSSAAESLESEEREKGWAAELSRVQLGSALSGLEGEGTPADTPDSEEEVNSAAPDCCF
ncbi:uncharacterized protein LOC141655498 [Silene latifolia]|uniref:uncharacterized protein LOC141655498 n=1 Tax=Silene latifolia TaxID=37657 RepID=UPI003D7880BC